MRISDKKKPKIVDEVLRQKNNKLYNRKLRWIKFIGLTWKKQECRIVHKDFTKS